MTVTIDAIYVNGVLKPLAPLNLAEYQKVTIQVATSLVMSAKPKPEDVTFKGIWPSELADDLVQALTEVRAETNRKLENLGDALADALTK